MLGPSVLPLYSSLPLSSKRVSLSLRPSSFLSTAPVPEEVIVMAHSCLMALLLGGVATVVVLGWQKHGGAACVSICRPGCWPADQGSATQRLWQLQLTSLQRAVLMPRCDVQPADASTCATRKGVITPFPEAEGERATQRNAPLFIQFRLFKQPYTYLILRFGDHKEPPSPQAGRAAAVQVRSRASLTSLLLICGALLRNPASTGWFRSILHTVTSSTHCTALLTTVRFG